MDQKDPQELLVIEEIMEILDHKAHKDIKAQLELLDQQDQ